MTTTEFLRARVPGWFGIDRRTLALFRVSLAAVTLFDLLQRLGSVRAFYTDFGVLPRAALAQSGETWRLSVHLANGETWFQAALITVQALLAFMVLVGHRTRAATLLTFVLLGSLHNRNPMLLTGADNLMMCLWFWALFLPWHSRFSVDAALSTREPPAGNHYLSWATAGLTLQVLSVYFFSAMLKSGRDWWPDGTAVYYALSLDKYATPLGVWLRDSLPGLLAPLSHFVYFLEWLAPLLAFAPFLFAPLRFSVMLALMLMHIGFLLCLGIGHFPFVSLASLTVLLGGWFWDRAGRRESLIKIYYDRDCGFCLASARLLKHFLVLRGADLLPAQDYHRARALMEAHYSWVVVDEHDVAHTKWNAFVALLAASPLLGWLAPLARLRVWDRPGAAVYDWVGRHRGAFGRLSAALLPARGETFDPGRGARRVAAVFVFVLLGWNLGTVGLVPDALRAAATPPVHVLRLDQYWDMFAPQPTRDDGWFLVPAVLADGREVDLLRDGAPVSYAKPDSIYATHETPSRWRKYRERIWARSYAWHREHYARYLCRDWNVTHAPEQRALSLKLVYMLERSVPPGESPSIEQRVLWRHDCLRPGQEPQAAVEDGAAE